MPSYEELRMAAVRRAMKAQDERADAMKKAGGAGLKNLDRVKEEEFGESEQVADEGDVRRLRKESRERAQSPRD